MVVFATLRSEESGKALFTGTPEACRDYIRILDNKNNYESLNLCQDNGEIVERAISHNMPTEWLIDLIEREDK